MPMLKVADRARTLSAELSLHKTLMSQPTHQKVMSIICGFVVLSRTALQIDLYHHSGSLWKILQICRCRWLDFGFIKP